MASILIVASHSSVLSSFNETLDTYLINIIFRWCVPFFFVVSGYFMKTNYRDFGLYIRKNLIIYILGSIAYIILLRIPIESVQGGLLYFIRGNIIPPFWFFPSLMMCMSFVFILNKLMKNPFYICCLTGFLFVFALIGGTLS